ncbi:Hypothetical_protein [Hexamita inflata]|uniref:Hypothetical_protein n=1 Tax=Hexamita inflata TaxID=28002 RepID=A0AA86P6L1_9EUKA|nr:Hypothetical protein HINF_LOCUS19074 [Hexamita inflata]
MTVRQPASPSQNQSRDLPKQFGNTDWTRSSEYSDVLYNLVISHGCSETITNIIYWNGFQQGIQQILTAKIVNTLIIFTRLILIASKILVEIGSSLLLAAGLWKRLGGIQTQQVPASV